jgi:AhpD family alkylhydroperoxidase
MSQRMKYASVVPDGMKAMASVLDYIGRSTLSKQLVDLVYLRVSQINGCAYCIGLHSDDLLKDGMAVEKLVLVPLWREAGALFSDQEQAALRWAETVTRVEQTGVPDDEFQAVARHFREKELADLTIAIGIMNAYNRLAISFRRTPEAAKPAK